MKRRSARFQAYEDFRQDERDQKMAARMRLVQGTGASPILSQKQRRAVVEQVRKSMDKWTNSPFEREGATRTALRSAFCLGGNGWTEADNEAERITSMSLAANGARRPTWEEGQWTYAVSEDYCKWCQRPMELGHAGRYCSAECARAAFVSRDFGERVNGNRAFYDAYMTVRRYSTPTQPCAFCKKEFRPRVEKGAGQEFCSRVCASKAKNAKAMAAPTTAVCVVCRESFLVHRLGGVAKYCCNACQVTGYRMSKLKWNPTRLNKQVFEQLIIGDAAMPIWITPERFDEMVTG